MKIFLPFTKYEKHPYIEEIKSFSENDFIFNSIFNFDYSSTIINIHWPEAVFDWKEPSGKDLENLEKLLIEIRRSAVIIYTKHDFKRTKGTTPKFSRLYKIIEENTDVFIHLGQFSKAFYERIFPKARHEIIYHPIYEKSFFYFSKHEARRQLGIESETTVVIAPGKIRSNEERNLVLKSFEALKIRNKVLISTNMRSELKFDFPGRVRMKKIFDVRNFFVKKFKAKYKSPQYLFTYSPRSPEDLSLRISAADIVMVPRVDILNSGLVFLGLTFGKVVVGPAVGNIKEQLEELNFPVFNPDSIKGVTRALEKGIKLESNGNFTKKPLPKFLPVNVAKEYDRIFLKYKK